MPNPDTPLRLGTRASPLAMAQAHMTRDALCAIHQWPESAVELVPMTASGDRITDRPLAEVGGKALWTRELDAALCDGRIDLAVHSMKDVETFRPTMFALAAMLSRADVRDRLIVGDGIAARTVAELPHGARVGTSSARRTAQLLRLRPDLQILLLRGNVATRLGKLARGEVDATLLAAAGLDRLGMADIGVAQDIATLLPAAAQGAIGIEVMAERDDVRGWISAIADEPTCRAVLAERDFLAAIGADCQSPLGVLAVVGADGQLSLSVQLLSLDGAEAVAETRLLMGADDAAEMARDMLTVAPAKVRALFAG